MTTQQKMVEMKSGKYIFDVTILQWSVKYLHCFLFMSKHVSYIKVPSATNL